MVKLFKFFILLLPFQFYQSAKEQDFKKWHEEANVVDMHNDVLIAMMRGFNIGQDLSPKTHSDLGRFKKGGVDAQFFSVWCGPKYGPGKAFRYANRQIGLLQAAIAQNQARIMLVRNPEQLSEDIKQQKLAALIGVEGGHMLENQLTNLDQLYNRGARYLTLTWNNSNALASSARDENRGSFPAHKKGLTVFGKQVIRRMNQLGMLVDLSHVGEKTFWDAINTATKPLIVSHSNAYRLAPHFRNLKDDQIKAIARNGGVIGLNFNSEFIDSEYLMRQKAFLKKHQTEVNALQKSGKSKASILANLVRKYPKEAAIIKPPLSKLIDHLDYIVKLVGINHVGLGSDFDGITAPPRELNSVADFPLITKELIYRGYSQAAINKILGENFIRVWVANAAA